MSTGVPVAIRRGRQRDIRVSNAYADVRGSPGGWPGAGNGDAETRRRQATYVDIET